MNNLPSSAGLQSRLGLPLHLAVGPGKLLAARRSTPRWRCLIIGSSHELTAGFSKFVTSPPSQSHTSTAATHTHTHTHSEFVGENIHIH